MNQAKQHGKSLIGKMCIFVVFVVLTLMIIDGTLKITSKQNSLNELQSDIDKTKMEIAEKNDMLKQDDKEFSEKIARSILDLGNPNETVYIDISGR